MFFTRRSHPATFPHTPSFRCPPYRQQATCLPVRKWATRGRLRPSTDPTLEAHETGRARSRSRDSRRGEPPEAGSGDETEDGAPYLHPDLPIKRVDSPVRAEMKTDQPPPDSGASRRQLSPAPWERHQLPPRARQGTTAATWPLRARQSATPRAPGTGAPMPPRWTWHTRRRGPSGRSTTPTRR